MQGLCNRRREQAGQSGYAAGCSGMLARIPAFGLAVTANWRCSRSKAPPPAAAAAKPVLPPPAPAKTSAQAMDNFFAPDWSIKPRGTYSDVVEDCGDRAVFRFVCCHIFGKQAASAVGCMVRSGPCCQVESSDDFADFQSAAAVQTAVP